MYSLLIDTHSNELVLVLYKDKEQIDIIEEKNIVKQSTIAMPFLEELLNRNNTTIKEIEEVIVVQGPGSFTGIRIGITLAKTLAFCAEIPIYAISSLALLIASNDIDERTWFVVEEKNGYYAAEYGKTKELVSDYIYFNKNDYENFMFSKNVNRNPVMDYNKIYEYAKTKNPSIVHNINPLYVKKIEVQK